MTEPIEASANTLVQAFYAAMALGDVEAVLTLASDDIVVVQSERLPWGGRYEGTDGLAKFAAAVRRHLSSRVTIDRLVAAGDQVAAIGWTKGTVVASGRPFAVPLVHLFAVRSQRLHRLEVIIDAPAMLKVLTDDRPTDRLGLPLQL